jgi:flavin-dependent dehydrogenase
VRAAAPVGALLEWFDNSILPAYAWIFPMADGVCNVGCGTMLRSNGKVPVDLHRVYQTFLDSPLPATAAVRNGRPLTPLRGGMLRYGLTGCQPAVPGGVLLAGETLGSTLPLSGEGIGKAMETAEVAAEVLHEALGGGDLATLDEYPRRLERRLRSTYKAYQMAQRFLAHPWLAEALARRAASSRRVRELLAAIIREEVPPDRLFSLGGLLRSLLG